MGEMVFGPQLPTLDDVLAAYADAFNAFPSGPPKSVEAWDSYVAIDDLWRRRLRDV